MESHVLFESAVGYALFKVLGAEVIGMEVDRVQVSSPAAHQRREAQQLRAAKGAARAPWAASLSSGLRGGVSRCIQKKAQWEREREREEERGQHVVPLSPFSPSPSLSLRLPSSLPSLSLSIVSHGAVHLCHCLHCASDHDIPLRSLLDLSSGVHTCALLQPVLRSLSSLSATPLRRHARPCRQSARLPFHCPASLRRPRRAIERRLFPRRLFHCTALPASITHTHTPSPPILSQEKAQDLSKFGKLVKLDALLPFASAQAALDNMNQISEGLLPDQLRDFLEAHLPKNPKKGKYVLGVADARLSQAVNEALSIPCSHTDAFPELIRGIRLHFTKMCEGMTSAGMDKAQLGLGHSYSRSKVKFNVHRVDNMIIQAISLLDQLDKDINTFSMRIK